MKFVEQVIATDLVLESNQPKFHLHYKDIIIHVFRLYEIIFKKVKNKCDGVQ